MAGDNDGKVIGLTILFGCLLGIVLVPFFLFIGCLGLISGGGGDAMVAGMVLGGIAGAVLAFFLGYKMAKAVCTPSPAPTDRRGAE